MSDDVTKDYSEDELEELEDKLLEEDFERHKEKMPVDGRSVFEIERLKSTSTPLRRGYEGQAEKLHRKDTEGDEK